jgi:hypothetical protein
VAGTHREPRGAEPGGALQVENRSQILATTSGEVREATAAFATRKR